MAVCDRSQSGVRLARVVGGTRVTSRWINVRLRDETFSARLGRPIRDFPRRRRRRECRESEIRLLRVDTQECSDSN